MTVLRVSIVLIVLGYLANPASAQVGGSIDIQTNRGATGTHFDLPASTTNFLYEADITTDPAQSFTLKLKVYKNGALKHQHTQTVVNPPSTWAYSRNVNMSTWGLAAGDCVTFHLKANLVAEPGTYAEHYLYGDVVNSASFHPGEGPDGGAWLVYLDRRSRFEALIHEVLA